MTNVVILTRDRPALLRQCIDSLKSSTEDHSLTIVDDGTADDSARNYLGFLPGPFCGVIHLADSEHNIGDLKTLGVSASRRRLGVGDWLCIADNDVFWMPGWLDRMHQIAIASEPLGYVLWGGQNHPFHKLWDTEVPGMKSCETLAGTHFFMRWSTWDKFGPLHSRWPGSLAFEDVDFCARIRDAGGKIGVASPPCVIDTGINGTNGAPSPGAVEKLARLVEGVIYQ